MNNASDASNYLLTVNQLSQQSIGTTQPPQFTDQTVFSTFPYLPFVLSGVLFVAAMTIQLMAKIRTARQMITALSIAVFAACIPTTLVYLQRGVGRQTQASPQTQPINLSVAVADSTTIQIHWNTQSETVGGLRIWTSDSDKDHAKLYFSNNREPTMLHITTVPNLVTKESYQFEILSGAEWYANGTQPMTFTMQ